VVEVVESIGGSPANGLPGGSGGGGAAVELIIKQVEQVILLL
jgi:hypothetical protein